MAGKLHEKKAKEKFGHSLFFLVVVAERHTFVSFTQLLSVIPSWLPRGSWEVLLRLVFGWFFE
jgi:hypothetical protein